MAGRDGRRIKGKTNRREREGKMGGRRNRNKVKKEEGEGKCGEKKVEEEGKGAEKRDGWVGRRHALASSCFGVWAREIAKVSLATAQVFTGNS